MKGGTKIFTVLLILATMTLLCPQMSKALTMDQNPQIADSDNDDLTDYQESQVYHTDPNNPDTDGDGYNDGHEVTAGYDPNMPHDKVKLEKTITVTLSGQTLTYSLGPYNLKTFAISSGDSKHRTPKGTYSILEKKPSVLYKGPGYYYPNTKWNLKFKLSKLGNYYIHGAYWHNKFGIPVSHGCINVSYANMENLYNWADVGTKIIIQ